MRLGSIVRFRAIHFKPRLGVASVVMGTIIAAGSAALAHHGPDSLFPTGNANWFCLGGGTGTGSRPFCLLTFNTSGPGYALTWWADWAINAGPYSVMQTTIENQFEPTDLTVTEAAAPDYSGNNSTRVIYELRGDVPSPAQGITWCDEAYDDPFLPGPGNSLFCNQTYVAFLSNAVIQVPLICHETGHAVGLTHGAQASPAMSQTDPNLSCMKTPVLITDTTLGIHNTTQMNVMY